MPDAESFSWSPADVVALARRLHEAEDELEEHLRHHHRPCRLELIAVAIDLTAPVVGSTGTFRASPKDQNGALITDPAAITIASDNPAVATVDAGTPDADGVSTDAIVTVVGPGTANISASDGTLTSNSFAITVAAPAAVLTSIDLEQTA